MMFSVNVFSLLYKGRPHKCEVYFHIRRKIHASKTPYIFSTLRQRTQ